MAIPTLAAIFLEIDALIIILVGMICLVLHEDTASRGRAYAYGRARSCLSSSTFILSSNAAADGADDHRHPAWGTVSGAVRLRH